MVGYGAQIQACSILSSRSRQPAEKKVDFFLISYFHWGQRPPSHPSSRLAVLKLHIIFYISAGEGRALKSWGWKEGWQAVISAIGKPINMCRSSDGLASWGTTQLLGMFAAACTILFFSLSPLPILFFPFRGPLIHSWRLTRKATGGLLSPPPPVCNCILNYSIARY